MKTLIIHEMSDRAGVYQLASIGLWGAAGLHTPPSVTSAKILRSEATEESKDSAGASVEYAAIISEP